MPPDIEKEKTELVWVPSSLANKIKAIQGTSGLEEEILSYIEDSKKDHLLSIESMDEDILLYRAKMIQARNAFREAKDAELDANYKLWEDYDKELSSVKSLVKEAKAVLEPLRQEIKDLNTEMGKLDLYRLIDFLAALKSVKHLVDSEKDMVDFLFKNYKR